MNSSSTRTQQTFYPRLEFWLNLIGAKIAYEYLNFYFILIVSLVGFFLNSTSLLILTRKSLFTSTDFYKFMRVYTLNSMILSLFLASTFVTTSYRFLSISSSYARSLFYVYVYVPFLCYFYLNSSLLEICMVFERISYFLPTRNRIIKKIGFKKLCLVVFSLSALVNSINYTLYTPSFLDAAVDENTVYRLFFLTYSAFSLTLGGKVLAYVMYFFRDILTMVIKLVLNGMSVVLLRSYLTKLKKEKRTFAERISSGSQLQSANVQAADSTYISRTDRNQTLVALIMCTFSLLEHVFYVPSYVFFIINISDLALVLYCLGLTSLCLKQVAGFVILYKFNSLFRKELREIYSNSLKRMKCMVKNEE